MCELKNDVAIQLADGTKLNVSILSQEIQIIFGFGTTNDKTQAYSVQMKICKSAVKIALIQVAFVGNELKITQHTCSFSGCPWETQTLHGAQKTNDEAVGSCTYTLLDAKKMIPFDM